MHLRIALLLLACCAAPAGAAPAAADAAGIEREYRVALAGCERVQGHGRELCTVQAQGEQSVRLAELAWSASPSPENARKLQLARAEADHATALVKCKAVLGAARDVCRQDAKLTLDRARTQAGLPRSAPAAGLRPEGTGDDAVQPDRVASAQFQAALERCDPLPALARPACVSEARQRFGRL
jgi:hypothetical protein